MKFTVTETDGMSTETFDGIHKLSEHLHNTATPEYRGAVMHWAEAGAQSELIMRNGTTDDRWRSDWQVTEWVPGQNKYGEEIPLSVGPQLGDPPIDWKAANRAAALMAAYEARYGWLEAVWFCESLSA